MSCERNRYRKLQVYTSVYKYRIFLYHSLLETLIIVCIYLLRKREIYKNDNFYYTVVLILKTNKVNSSRKYRRRNATHFLLLRNFFSDLWTLLNNPVQSIRKSSRRTSFQPNFSSSNNPSSIFVECRRICACFSISPWMNECEKRSNDFPTICSFFGQRNRRWPSSWRGPHASRPTDLPRDEFMSREIKRRSWDACTCCAVT